MQNPRKTRPPRRYWAVLTACLTLTYLAQAEDPEITTQPTTQVVSVGGTAQFSAVATTADYPLTYQWQHTASSLPDGFTNLAGSTTVQLEVTNVLKVANVVAEQGGDYYRLVVRNASGNSVTSQVARLTVDPTFLRINSGPGGTDAEGSIGVAWGDYDGDGYPDLFIANLIIGSYSVKSAFWHNNKDGTFTKILTGPPATALDAWWYPFWVDYDNDGDLDLHALISDTHTDRFYRNEGDGVFKAMTPEFVKTNPYGSSWGEICGWADFDNDGWLDVLIPRNNGTDLFFRGYPNGVFRAMTANDVGPVVAAPSYHVGAIFDYDNDGWPDLLVEPNDYSNTYLKCRLYHNEGYGVFKHITEGDLANQWALVPGYFVSNFAVGDYNNDGYFDVFVPGGEDGYRGRLYRNEGQGNFTVDALAGVDRPLNSGCSSWVDYDNDGNLDLFVDAANYGGPLEDYGNESVMYRNNGDGTFTSVEIGSPLHDGVRKSMPTWVDFDQDGFMDMFHTVGNGVAERNYLYHNNLPAIGSKNHWLKVRLVGKASNSMGVGAKVRVTATIRGKVVQQLRQITVPGTVTQEDYLAHFGLGDATKVDLLRIEWPSGIVQEMKDVAVDPKPYLEVVETQNPDPLHHPQMITSNRAADGTFHATVKNTSSAKLLHVLEASTDLVKWSKIQVRTNLVGTMEFTDASTTNAAARFYRVVVP